MQKVEKRTKNITFYYILYKLFYIFVLDKKHKAKRHKNF